MDNSIEKHRGQTFPTPFRFRKNMDHDSVAPFGKRSLVFDRMRQDASKMDARTGNHCIRRDFQTCEPADVFAPGDHVAQLLTGFHSESFEQMRLKIAHVLKHPRPMPGDNIRVINRRQTDLKFVSYFYVHALWRSVCIRTTTRAPGLFTP